MTKVCFGTREAVWQSLIISQRTGEHIWTARASKDQVRKKPEPDLNMPEPDLQRWGLLLEWALKRKRSNTGERKKEDLKIKAGKSTQNSSEANFNKSWQNNCEICSQTLHKKISQAYWLKVESRSFGWSWCFSRSLLQHKCRSENWDINWLGHRHLLYNWQGCKQTEPQKWRNHSCCS